MKELTNRHVYIACPIDDGNSQVAGVRLDVRTALLEAAVNYYDPAGAWGTPQPLCSSHMPVNDLTIRTSLGMIAILAARVCSVGVPMEIKQAHDLGLPVVVLTNVQSRQLAAMDIPMYALEDYGQAIGDLIHRIKSWHYRSPVLRDLKFTSTDPSMMPPLLDRAYSDDAGFDLPVVGLGVTLLPGEFKDIPTGIAVQMPPGTWGMIVGRSSTIRKRGLLVHTGVIDNGFRGELFAACQNVHPERKSVNIAPGERLAQLIVMPNATESVRPMLVEALDPSERGTRGFGSSGK